MKPVRVAFLCLAAPALAAVSLRAAPRPEPVITPIPTEITSAGPAEMVSTATESIFTFQDQVVVVGTNLRLTCDRLVVVAKRTGDPKATLGKQQNFKSLVATGHVRLVQAEREALCDRAEVLPGEDKVILTGNPATVRSVDGVYAGSGPKMTLLRGQQRAVIDAPRFVLPALDDIGPGNKKPKTVAPAPTTAPAADPTTPPPITVPIPPVSVPPK